MKPWFLLLLLGLVPVVSGCATASYAVAPLGALPNPIPDLSIPASPHFAELQRTYGKGISYERAKIKYLLGIIKALSYQFHRNGLVYNSTKTAKHLQVKYRKRIKNIQTARDFINQVASISTVSGRPYLALPGDGMAYRTGDLLNYELSRLETYMALNHGRGGSQSD